MRRFLCAVALSCIAAFSAATLSTKASSSGGNTELASPTPSAIPSPVALPLDARSNVDSLIGWPSGARVVAERKLEATFMTMPSAAGATEFESHLSSRLHRAGSPGDYETSVYVRDRLQADGFEVNVVPFEVSYTQPTRQWLEIVSPRPQKIDLLEGEPGHHTAAQLTAGPAFMENSGDGDVTAPIFYVNKGQPEDWQAFDDLRVAMPAGSIVLVRWGFSRDPHGAQRFYEELQKRKVGGFIEYEDASDDGFMLGEMWPKGNFKTEYMAERISGPKPTSPSNPPGDPTLPGQAPLPGVPHKSFDEIPHATIPEMDVTQHVARELLARMTGPVVPADWHGAFEMVEHVGGNERVHMAVRMDRKLVTIWNLFGTLHGAKKPEETVVIGSHRDAMAFGAIDPGSGTTVMLQIADAYAKLTKSGWRPDRTIEIASWDGHELGLWGSISLAYAHGDLLRKHVVQYINTDQLTTGPPFVAAASPGLWTFSAQVAGAVNGLDGKPLMSADSPKKPVLVAPGGGSDHLTFISMLGIPGTTAGYYGDFGAHHTAEDNIGGIQTYDPGYRQGVIMAQYTGVQAMRVASATVPPLRISELPALMLRDLSALSKEGRYDGVDFAPLRGKLDAFLVAAKAVDAQSFAAEASGNESEMAALYAKAERARGAFYSPEGLSYNKYWHRVDRLVGAFPELNFASYETDDKEAKIRKALDRLNAAVDAATSALE